MRAQGGFLKGNANTTCHRYEGGLPLINQLGHLMRTSRLREGGGGGHWVNGDNTYML